MTDIALPPTPAQKRMAAARAARNANKAAVATDMAAALAPDVVAQAKAQRAEIEAAELAAQQRAAREEQAARPQSNFGPGARERAAAKAAAEIEAKHELARSMATAPAEAGVKVRISKLGHNKISKGIHVGGVGEVYWAWRDETTLPLHIAQAHEDAGRVEIIE
jgi:hypothetical protein